MEDQYGVCDSSQSEIENPLLWPMLEILKRQPSGWKVHTLASKLSERGYINQLDPSPDKDLFKRNFLIMNALYQLQETLFPDSWLQVEAMDIMLMSALEASRNSVDPNDPLRQYYLDWSHYEANEDEVRRLLNEFWSRYQRFVGDASEHNIDKVKALKLFDLAGDASRTEIRRQWRKLALRWHPDRENGDAERFRVLCEAWNVLRNG
ncbi:TPA: DNA-J related domain-containing protein [Vibrio parahaemolyticus]|uniref:DNA-J related domain-containing protein n=1 Tax=Vibrio parahaemolyticus TaxID=670 RepID=UPI000FEC872F|nr:DNA-J related domain-containing protein [Vibrio parahaemolyticus]MBM5080672.1 DnaJ domain-containing protein [Vibrio parahaemolyticus]MCX8884144.1 DnaJ domain-containing protein [Vibrio parahaemolyticus]NNU11627.1 DnaJ domain-containing protein [Vibrio parahaemolyticus]QQE17264.1 DnaJ domain-containing protein [Vibrio parahaemolyticus]TOE65959.1 molecular chaperone DnaJ [Vibrio parahaemolyticus]